MITGDFLGMSRARRDRENSKALQKLGAGGGDRTPDIDLGKVALYR